MKYSIKRRSKFSRLPVCLLSAVIAVLAFMPCALAQGLTARGVFEKLQSPAFETLKKTIRLDMLDYWDADSVYHAKNAIGGESWIETLTPGYAKVRLTPVSVCEIKLLPVKNDTIVMTIFSVGEESGVADSEISFFDRDLRELDSTPYFRQPPLESFFSLGKGAPLTIGEIKETISFPAILFGASPDNDLIEGKLTISSTLDVDMKEKLSELMTPGVSMKWQNGTFRLEKGKNKK